MTTVTYTGFAPRGRVMLPSGERPFTRGTPLEVDAADAAALDDDWTTVQPTKPKAAKAKAPTPEEG